MNWVDGVVLGVASLGALRGWHTGAARQVLAFSGLLAGLLLGVLVAPVLVRPLPLDLQAAVAILLVLALAFALAATGDLAGRRLAGVMGRFHLMAVDRTLGVATAVVATLTSVWLIASMVAGSRLGTVDRAVQGSVVVRAVNGALPSVPSLFTRIDSFLSERGFPVVFADIPPQLLAPSHQATGGEVAAALAAAGPSTVKVVGPACSLIVAGSGVVLAPHLVVTNAHVVAGDQHPTVVDARGSHAAVVVLFDPELDVAVLDVPGLSDPVLPVDTADARRGTTGAVLGYPEGGGLTGVPAAVDGTFSAVGLDIYGNAVVTRQVYQLHTSVLPGNSGGPLVELSTSPGTSGKQPRVAGLVFGRSTSRADVGYALTMRAVEAEVHKAEAARLPVSAGACTGG